MHVGIANTRWRGKRSRHSQRMLNTQFYVSDKRPMTMVTGAAWSQVCVKYCWDLLCWLAEWGLTYTRLCILHGVTNNARNLKKAGYMICNTEPIDSAEYTFVLCRLLLAHATACVHNIWIMPLVLHATSTHSTWRYNRKQNKSQTYYIATSALCAHEFVNLWCRPRWFMYLYLTV